MSSTLIPGLPSITTLQTIEKKEAIREHFNRLASQRAYWQHKASTYYEDQMRYFQFLVPQGHRVLEVGSGLGYLLAALKPSRGVGVDLSEEMVREAIRQHPSLEFHVGDAETLELRETFDVVILADVIGHLLDVEAALKRLHQACMPETRTIVAYYNYLWEPVSGWGRRLESKCPSGSRAGCHRPTLPISCICRTLKW